VNDDDNVAQPVGPQNQNHQNPVTDDEDSDSESDGEAGLGNLPVVETIDLANEEDDEPKPTDDPEAEEPEDTQPPSGRPKRKKTARKVYIPEDGTIGGVRQHHHRRREEGHDGGREGR
jgi:hypothetical protein